MFRKSLMATTKVFVTHMHGDHIFGLPSLLMQVGTIFMIGKQPEVEVHPIHIYGPAGLHQYLCTVMRLTETSISREIVVHEMRLREDDVYRLGNACTWKREWEDYNHDYDRYKVRDSKNIQLRTLESDDDGLWNLVNEKGLSVKAGLISHKIPCYGFVVKEGDISGKMVAEKVDELGVSREDRPKLKLGLDVVDKDGNLVKYSDVCGPSVPGRKVVILGDTDNPSLLTEAAQNCDLLVHECTFANSKLSNALRSGHSTPAMAIKVAHKFNARRVALNHIGSQYVPFNMDAANFDAGLVTDGDLEAQAKDGFGLRREHIHVVRDFETVRVPSGGFSLTDKKFVSRPDAIYYNQDKPQRASRPHSKPSSKDFRGHKRVASDLSADAAPTKVNVDKSALKAVLREAPMYWEPMTNRKIPGQSTAQTQPRSSSPPNSPPPTK